MKRSLSLFSILVLTYLFLATVCQAQDSNKRFSFKLTVGYGSMAVGDLNAVIESTEKYFSLYESEKEGGLKELGRGLEYEGELIVDITEHFGFGIGAGYITREEQSKVSWGSISSSHHHEIRAVPIKLTAYYSTPIASRLNFYLSGGIGYYIGKIDYNTLWEWQIWFDDFIFENKTETDIETKDNVLGFHGGFGVEYNVAKDIAIFIEGTARYAKISDWKGDQTSKSFGEIYEKTSGILWYYEYPYFFFYYPEPDPDKYFSDLIIGEEKPNFEYIRNARKAEGDFSGFSLRAGIKIKF